MRLWWLSSLLLLASAGAHAQAGKVVIYRCTDALGQLTVQNNTPCPKGSQQQKRVIEDAPVSSGPSTLITSPYPQPNSAPPHPPVSSQLPSVATPPNARPVPKSLPQPAGPPIADADRLPPPVLFECRTYDSSRYLSDDGKPPQRCAQLQTTGLGGTGSGTGVACEMVDDQCQRIPDDHLCENWKQRLREAQSALRFGRSDNQDASATEVARIQRIVTESTCGKAGR